ncbi:head maturation protease, ClpP-related [Muricoccus nepalensis]|nr:head maturation protease, ClpP-related [Roseomonas nepalensis]
MPKISPAASVAAYLRKHGSEDAATAIVAVSPLSERAMAPKFRAADDGPVEVLIMGEIGWEVTAQGVLDVLNAAGERDLVIRISSPGGSAFEGFAIFNLLARYPGLKQVVVESVAASSASFIAMAGDEVFMAPASFMMIHNSAGMTMGDKQAHAATIAILEKIDATMAGLYAARTGKTSDEVLTLMSAETWMTAEEAVTEGFADRVEAAASPAPSADPAPENPDEGGDPLPDASARITPRARVLLNSFAHAPAAVRAMASAAPQSTPTTPSTQPAAPAPQQETTMSGTATTTAPGGTTPAPAVVTGPQPATLEQLQGIAARAKLGSDWVVAQLVAKATEATARDAALDALAGQQAQRPGIVGVPTASSADTDRASVAAIAKRGGVKKPEIIAAAGPMAGLSLQDMAADFYEARTGKRARLPTAQLYREVFASGTVGMQTSGDFGVLLGQSIEAIVIDNAQRVSQEWRKIGRVYSFDNFRQRDVAGAFDAPDLEEVLEHEEIRYGAIQRALGRLGLKTFAKGFAFSRQAIINNDLTQFTADGATYGAMAARSLSARVWRVFQLGTTSAYNMTDGQPFLSAAHNNLAASGSAITEASLIAAANALASQAAVAGKPLGLAARYLVVGTGRRFEAQKLMASLKLADNTDNVFNGAYEIVYEPSFPENAWALMADPDVHPIIAVSVLNGREDPEVVTEASFDTFGLKVRVSLDYEAAPIDWNGVYYNPGPA